MRTHILKSWSPFFDAILKDTRTHELRRNDRSFQVGDLCDLQEYDNVKGTYTGRSCNVVISSITSKEEPCAVSGDGLHPDFCILSIKRYCTSTA